MLSVTEAQEAILQTTQGLGPESVSLDSCPGRTLAETIRADRDYPAFDNSAVDGYAFRLSDGLEAVLCGSIVAGAGLPAPLPPKSAARILTGAPLPPGADTVAMQEDCVVEPDRVTLPELPLGKNVRRTGEDFRAGDIVLQPGTKISPSIVSLLATIGAIKPICSRRPRVALFTTGDELYPPDMVPPPGGLRDSNLPLLQALCADQCVVTAGRLPDDLELTRLALQRVDADVVITSGGVSVGDRDFVRQAAEIDAEVLFWRVAIRPGKPLLVADFGKKRLFGLPGNPASTLVTFHLFVRPALLKLAGRNDVLPLRIPVLAGADYAGTNRRTDYVRVALVEQGGSLTAIPVGLQGSHGQISMARANALLEVPETGLIQGAPAKAILT